MLVARPGPTLGRGLAAVALGFGVTFGWLYHMGLRWGDVEAAAFRGSTHPPRRHAMSRP